MTLTKSQLELLKQANLCLEVDLPTTYPELNETLWKAFEAGALYAVARSAEIIVGELRDSRE